MRLTRGNTPIRGDKLLQGDNSEKKFLCTSN
jgi:hypothetical protein